LLTVEDVYAGYGGGDVLQGTTFAVNHGSITCVIGPNGAGKSTVGAVISGVHPVRRGAVRLAGEEITGFRPRRILERGVVQVPQNHSLFRKMTVRENVEFGAFLLRDRALVRRRYNEVVELFPVVREHASQKAGSLSGGQQRLVEFARSLMMSPRLVILDEPSLGLDPHTMRAVFGMIRQMNSTGLTVLLIEQNARAALRLSSHAIVLESGRVRLAGSGRDVLGNPEIGQLFLGGVVGTGAA
jgi:branched-chain amino acid transport system ATP-binding protein